MLPPVASLNSDILALPLADSIPEGMANLTNVIASYMANMQAGATGSPGIFALGKPAMVAILSAAQPVPDNSWTDTFANALEAGIMTAVITPGTVVNPVWLGSTVDIATLPTGAATITTVSAAKAAFKAGLANATASNNPAMPFSQAVMDASLQFIFTCIGLGSPPALPPIPVPTPAQ